MVTLDAANATVLQEGGVPVGTVSVVWESGEYGWPASPYTITWTGTHADGDLLVLVAGGYSNETTINQNGFTNGGNFSGNDGVQFAWKVWHTGQPTSYNFVSGGGGIFFYSLYILRGTDLTTPVAAVTHGTFNATTTPTAPTLTVPASGCCLMWYEVEGQVKTVTLPAGFTNQISGGGGPFKAGGRKLNPATGATGGVAGTLSGSDNGEVMMVCWQPPLSAIGNYYRWRDSSSINQGWAYYKDQVPGPTTIRQGGPIAGYWIEARYPATLGGSLSVPHVRVDVWNYAQTIHNVYEWSLDVPPDIYVWACNYIQPPSGGGWPGGTPPDPYSCPTDTLASIAAAICTIRRTQGAMYGYITNINTLLGALYGPWSGTVGQAQETASGHLGEFLQQALRAMSNYYPIATTEMLVVSAATGDLEIDLAAEGYGPNAVGFRIQLTTIPAFAGHREGVPYLYEVNTRAEQLGWTEWELTDGLYGFERLVWGVQYVKNPRPLAEKFHMHLRPGVVADVYSIVEWLKPALTP